MISSVSSTTECYKIGCHDESQSLVVNILRQESTECRVLRPDVPDSKANPKPTTRVALYRYRMIWFLVIFPAAPKILPIQPQNQSRRSILIFAICNGLIPPSQTNTATWFVGLDTNLNGRRSISGYGALVVHPSSH